MEKWVTTAEVAEHIGKSSGYVLANARRLQMPFVKVGTQLRWKLSAVEEWMQSQAEDPR